MTSAGLGKQISVVKGALQDFIDATLAQSPSQRPTALICYTHFLAISTLRLLWERGVRVPQDVSVATFSNSYPVAEVIPPLTTVALPTEEMGRAAAEMVVEQIQSSGEAEPRRVVLKETLIVRKSTGARQVLS
jgi:LacI family transcriptional regulator